jgi:hypothetical protein
MQFRDILMVAAQQGGGAAAPSGPTWPFTDVSPESLWTFTGDAVYIPALEGDPALLAFAENPDDSAALTGAAIATFDAAVPDSTACSVTLTGPTGATNGIVLVSLKGGTPVEFAFSGTPSEIVNHTVTSGAGSGFLIASDPALALSGGIIDIEIA